MSSSASTTTVIACHHWFDDVIGGSFRLATEFAEHAAAAGRRVVYVCCGRPDQTEDTLRSRERGVDVWRYSPPRRGGRLSKLRYHVRRSADLVRELRLSASIDLVHGHSPLQHLGAAGALKDVHISLHYVVHSPFDDELISNAPTSTARWKLVLAGAAARSVERRNLRRASVVQTDSSFTLAELRRKYPRVMTRKGVVAPGWVDSIRFCPSENRLSARRTLGGHWETDVPLFLTVRRLEPRMGLDTLVEAAALVAGRGRAFRVLIGGGGSQREVLEKAVTERGLQNQVFFLGRVPEELLALSYSAADCFVLPTRALECFGLIVLEAWATATPVIASRVAAIPELVEQQGADWLFTVDRAEELADRMERFMDGRLVLNRGVRELAGPYSRERVLDQWMSLAYPFSSSVSSRALQVSRN
jgi:glycosyltransferase involved in cell wall biosynthesis